MVKVKMESKIWKTYPEIEWLQGSRFGQVRTKDRYVAGKNGSKRLIKGRVLKQQRNRDGYLQVGFGVDGKYVTLYVQRVIASCFLPNPNGLEQVNHKNAVRTDNRVENLEWCSCQENIAYRDKLGHTARYNAPKSPVIAINLTTLEVLQFPSQSEAARQLGADQRRINDVIKGRQKTAYGYWFTNADSEAVSATKRKLGSVVANQVEELMNELQPA